MKWAFLSKLAASNATDKELDIAKVMLDVMHNSEERIQVAKLQDLLIADGCHWAESTADLLVCLETFKPHDTLQSVTKVRLIDRIFEYEAEVLYWTKWRALSEQIFLYFDRFSTPVKMISDSNEPQEDKQQSEDSAVIKLNKKQQEALELMLSAQAGIVTGAPGMGKSTVIKQAVQQSKDQHILVCAPSAAAVMLLEQDLAAVKDKDTKHLSFQTIHRSLGFGFNGQAKFNSLTKFHYDWVIVDEVSMVASDLMYQLISALKPSCRLTIVGDQNQLGAINVGNFFSELVNRCAQTNKRYLTVLDQHIRLKPELISITDTLLQEVNSAASIRFADSKFKPQLLQSEAVIWHRIEEWSSSSNLAGIILQHWQNITRKSKTEFFQLELSQLPLIISSRRTGMIGSERINAELYDLKHQSAFDELPKKLSSGTPIIINKNDHRQALYNSQLGILSSNNQVRINEREIPLGLLPDFSLGWAITVHRSQGKENNLVFVIIDDTEEKLINKHLIYTALTRTKNKIVVIAKDRAFQHLFSEL